MTWWHIPVYLLDLSLMVYLSYLLGNLVDELDRKTKISGAFIGGVLLAAVTSLPELFTALSSIFFVNEPEYVVGDILGSIIFDIVVLAIETMMFMKSFRNAKIEKFHLTNGVICLLMYGFAAYAFIAPVDKQVMLGDINLMSVLIFGLYILSLFIQPKENGEKEIQAPDIGTEKKKGMTGWSVKKIWIAFAFCSIALIASSIALTYLTKFLQEDVPALTGSVAGALLLGIGTSIPEVISTFQLFRKKNFDAGFGNIIGSCTFDFAIFALADFLSWRQWNNHINKKTGNFIISERGLFIVSPDAIQFEIFGAIVCLSFILFVILKLFTNIFSSQKNRKTAYALTISWAVICTALYLLIFIL